MGQSMLNKTLMVGWAVALLGGVASAQPAGDRYGSAEGVALKTAQAPVLDGDLSDACWQKAQAAEQFTDLDGRSAPFRKTSLKFVSDDSCLYIGARCDEPNPEKLKAIGKPGQDVWQDDCLELFFHHTKEAGEYVQFICNSRDVHEEYMYSNSPGPKWSPSWTSKTKILKDGWTTEIRIPLKELGTPQPVLAGDFLELKVGREIWSDFRPVDAQHPVRYAVWPARQVYNAGGRDFGRIYLIRKNVLPNPEFEGQPNAAGFYPGWSGDREAATRYRVLREGGEAVMEVAADRASGWMSSGIQVRQGDSYRYRLEVKGDAPSALYVRVPMAIEQRLPSFADWTPVEIPFSTAGPGGASVYFGVYEKTPGKKAFFRRMEVVKETSSSQPYYLTWKIKEPLLDQGLGALRARRFGIKPYELIARSNCQGERVVFRDTSTGTPLCLMTRDRSSEGHYYHNLEWIFSFNGKWLASSSSRLESSYPKTQLWATRTDGTAVVPLVKYWTFSHHWSPWDPDVYYHDVQANPGQLCSANVETGERTVLAQLGPWVRPMGILVRPGAWSNRLVIVNPDLHTGFTIRRDGSDRKNVVFEPPASKAIGEMYFSTGFPNIFYSREGVYRLEKDGAVNRVGNMGDREHWANMARAGHADASKSEKYLARPSGTVTRPDGREAKVYDPALYMDLGGHIGHNGYASWGPTDDWFTIEHGQHFVRARADGRGQDFLGFHFAKSLDYYSMAWGQVSPDGTKIACKTTLLDNPDLLMMVVAPPQPPARPRVEGGDLVWEPAPLSAETQGYFVHGSRTSGGPYEQAHREPIRECRWKLPATERPAFYVVSAVEHSGLASPYSAEAAVNAGDAPRWFYAEAETLALETPVVERREMSATGWHYVAQDPYLSVKLGKEGRLAWTFSVPAPLKGKAFSLWIRARRAKGASEGRASIQAGATAASASTASENWTWACAGDDAGKPARFAPRDGRIDAALTLRNHSIEIDSLALTTDASGRPRPEGAVDNAPPQPPKDLRAAKADSGAILLSWQPSPDADAACYNVYASTSQDVAAVQRNLVGSPSALRFVDWGLKAGTTYDYLVTAVDRYGNESAGTPASAATDAKTIRTLRLAAANAKLEMRGDGPSLEVMGKDPQCSGGRFVGVAVPGNDAMFPNNPYALGARIKLPAKRAALTWKVTAQETGVYVVWIRVRSRASEISPDFALDRKSLMPEHVEVKVGWYDARVAQSMWGKVEQAYCWFWTQVPLGWTQLDPRALRVTLPAGEHDFTLSNITPGLDVDEVVLTTDFAWIPEGTINYF